MTGRHTSPCTALYCIYTSGSTGEPKGVVMEHRNLVAFSRLKAHDEGIGADRQSRVLLASTFTFDLCEGDLYASLITGGTVVTAPRDALLDLRRERARVAERRAVLALGTGLLHFFQQNI